MSPGYKQTEVGVIPVDWDVAELGECLVARPDYGINAPAVPYSDRLPMYIRITDITEDGGFSPDKLASVNAEYSDAYFLSDGDIVLARTGASVGKSYRYKTTDGPLVFAGFLIRVKPDGTKLLPGYVASYLKTGSYWRWVQLNSMRSGQPGINGNEYAKLPLPLPPLPEQSAIATALSDVDALLSSLDALIAKKRDVKQAAMQQLLTGRTRLPGLELQAGTKQTEVGVIPNDWHALNIGSILEEISMGPFGSDITVSNFVSAGVPVLNGANVAQVRLIDNFENFVTPQKARSLKKAVARRGDIVVTHRGTIGQISYVPEDSEFESYVVSQSQFRARFSRMVLPEWVVRYFHTEGGSKRLLEGKGHTGVPAIAQPTTTFRSLFVPVPPLHEQSAITEVLSDMDAELAALEDRRDKTRLLKQGMMQELLTGKTRLV
ncbi:restriction modification system DNA specificity domain-containing protein [Burkholderia pseudomallei]|nr:restriction modification system DNA specificity domain-containing protein [Burkholderia pseudomallei]